MKKMLWAFLGLAAVLTVSGCDTALVMGNRVVGVESGKFYYTDGVLKTDYLYDFDQVWTATGKVLKDLKAVDLQSKKKIAKGTVDCVIIDEKVHVEVEYASKGLTNVFIRTGIAGNQLASKMILEKIRATLEAQPSN